RRELRRIEQRLQTAADNLRALFHGLDGLDAHAFRGVLGTVLIERRGGDTIWKTFHDQRTVSNRRQDDRSDFHVIAEQVALRELLLWPEDLVKVRDAKRVASGKSEETVAPADFDLAQLIDQGPTIEIRFLGGPQGPHDFLLRCGPRNSLFRCSANL